MSLAWGDLDEMSPLRHGQIAVRESRPGDWFWSVMGSGEQRADCFIHPITLGHGRASSEADATAAALAFVAETLEADVSPAPR